MSPTSNAPKDLAPASAVRSNALHAPDAAGVQPYPLASPTAAPRSLSHTGRSKTAPLAPEQFWSASSSTRDRPQLSDRDSIFATTYLASDSPSSSPRLPPHDATAEQVPHHGMSTLAGPVAAPLATPRRLMESPMLLRQHTASRPATLKDHQGLLSTHFNHHKHFGSAMDAARARQSPPPFMSPVDSPIQRPTTPHPSDSPPAARPLLDKLTESEERLKYRSWREGNAEFPHTSAMAQQLRSDRPHVVVDKKIEATISKAEQPSAARSRKASHYLRVFKENDAAEEKKKKRDGRVRQHGHAHQDEGLGRLDGNDIGYSTSRPSSAVQSPIKGPLESYFQSAASTPPIDVERKLMKSDQPGEDASSQITPKQGFPLELLKEIRSYGNLTPAGTSFSKSLPTSAAERLRKAGLDPRTKEPSDYFQEVVAGSEEHDEEDSEKEQISSALYFPHRQLQTPDQIPEEAELAKSPAKGVQEARAPVPSRAPKGWSAETAVKAPEEVEISLQSQDTNQCLHGDMPSTSALSQASEKSLASSPDFTTGSDYESVAESWHSHAGDESSATDDLGTTPTPTPRKKEHRPPPTSHPHPPAPLGAVELKPYDHQVGGHTTVYRFSRRAVCKQLNNRENEFYETVERHHPELLEFLPRYIGVLNVTYRKAPKRRKTVEHKPAHEAGAPNANGQTAQGDAAKQELGVPGNDDKNQARVVSHSQKSMPVPQVIFENNRHIIPQSLFGLPPRSATPNPGTGNSYQHQRNYSDEGLVSDRHPTRPALQQHSSWGVTTINTKLQEEVLRQVFAPPPIHHRPRHGHHHTHHHGLPRKLRDDSQGLAGSAPSARRNSTDVADFHAPFDRESPRKQVLKSEARRQQDQLGTSSPVKGSKMSAVEELRPPPATLARRRHSGGGLTRRPCGVDTNRRSNLEYYEEDAYGADGEEEVFVMDDDHGGVPHTPQKGGVQEPKADAQPLAKPSHEVARTGTMLPAPVTPKPKSSPPLHREPANPKEAAHTQPDERVQHFLLLEDLTAGMEKPCVLDLKMGTRQYGVEADEKKQRSQRRKCQMTTSRELGVRVCGMQIWNVKTQSYVFEDKYFGRDLKAGKEFQDALKRFFFDGIGYKAALRHIPVILEKISTLEGMIRNLPGYRFYASSLLMLYDRAPKEKAGDRDGSHTGGEEAKKVLPEIKLKIVDFANCVTAEDSYPHSVPCPPHDPHGIDRGYLRGLRSLRLYFQRIWRDINEKDWVERGEGEGIALDERALGEVGKAWMDADIGHEDPGYVSI